MIRFECPYPPSGNSRNEMSIRNVRGGKKKIYVKNSDSTRIFYSYMRAICHKNKFKKIIGPCEVSYWAWQPTDGQHDIDNIEKTLFDGLKKGQFIEDDNLILVGHQYMCYLDDVEGAGIIVEIKPVDELSVANKIRAKVKESRIDKTLFR